MLNSGKKIRALHDKKKEKIVDKQKVDKLRIGKHVTMYDKFFFKNLCITYKSSNGTCTEQT